MQNFIYHNPTRLLFGEGQIARINREIPKGAKILMTYGGGSIKANGVYDQVKAALDRFEVLEFGGIEPNPSYETLMEGVKLARAEKVDFLLAVGGGSVLDGTKFMALAIPFEGEPWDILARQARPERAIAVGSIMTLPATGSESNGYAVISRRETREKLSFGSPLAYPLFAVLDPRTTLSLPHRQVANGVVDAFVHVMEQYLTYPVGAYLQDRFAEGILQTLIEVGPKTLADPSDYTLRANFVWCATMGLNGLIGMGVPQDWSTHMLGHELTAFHGVDHGRSLAIVMPNLLYVQRESKKDKLLQYAERVWGVTAGSEAVRMEAGIVKTREFFESMDVSTHLSDYNINVDRTEDIIERFKVRKMLPMGEKKDLDEAKIREILALAN